MKTAIATDDIENPKDLCYITYNYEGHVSKRSSLTLRQTQKAVIIIQLNKSTGDIKVLKNRLSPTTLS